MIKHFDHFTLVVEDEAEAKRFFALLGFSEDTAVVIAGERFAEYMGFPGWRPAMLRWWPKASLHGPRSNC